MNAIVPVKSSELYSTVDNFANGLRYYLERVGLPAEDVLVSVHERGRAIANLPAVLDNLSDEQRQKARYISKFVAACGAGLFDAALNFLWNETIVCLREKIARYDLEYFFDSVVTDPNRRASLRDKSDLGKLEDWELIRGCRQTGILSEVGFRHLDYIRDMRNWASAAHPNQAQLTGLQVVTWLETCIREVLAREPDAPALELKRLLVGVRTQKLSKSDSVPITANIQKLPMELAQALLRALYGMYSDPKLGADVRNNIRQIAPAVWNQVDDEARYEAGFRYAIHSVHADIPRKRLAHEFLTLVDGLAYLPKEQLAVEIAEKAENLMAAHLGFNNFYNEPPHARALAAYIPQSGVIHQNVRQKYVKTVVMCRIGNGYGVSRGALPYYEELIDRFQEKEIKTVLRLLKDKDIQSRLQLSQCRENFRMLGKWLKERTQNVLLQRGFEMILEVQPHNLPAIYTWDKFKKLLASLEMR